METNSLVYKVGKKSKDFDAVIKIKLNDECKNGHQDFSITADLYEHGKPESDKYCLGGGCCHDDILKIAPEFKQFVNLHLCDKDGIPMYASANGYYHITIGFDNTTDQKEKFCEYYRVTPLEYEILKQTSSADQYGFMLVKLGIVNRWKTEAKEAIKELERLTGDTFINDSKKSNLGLTPERLTELEKLDNEGYFSPENIAQRKAEQLAKLKADKIAKIEAEYKQRIELAEKQKAIELFCAENILTDNVIYHEYKGDITVNFNWKTYEIQTPEADILKAFSGDIPTILKGIKINNNSKEVITL
jgi:hypothetical protein